MTATTRRMRPRRGRGLGVAAVAAACLLAAACGKKGNPLPPVRIIPNATTDLKVAQRGNQLVLRFAFPQTTTAGAKLPGLAAVEVWDLVRPLPANSKQYPVVDPKELAGAKRIASLSGPELESAIEGGHVVVRLPLPAVESPAASSATPVPIATPAPSPDTTSTPAAAPSPTGSPVPGATPAPTPRPAPTPIPGPVPPASGGTLHVYAVKTVAKDGETSGFSNLVMLLPQPAPPPPSGLEVETAARAIDLKWKKSDGGVGFAVYRRLSASRTYGDPIATVGADVTSYSDASATYGNQYIYTVTTLASQDPRVESGFGEEREVSYEDRFAPAPPEDLVALAQSGAVSLVWQASPDADAVGYLVYRQDPGADFRKLTAAPIAELKYDDSGLTPGLLFRYRATAVDKAGNEGPPTPIVEARPR